MRRGAQLAKQKVFEKKTFAHKNEGQKKLQGEEYGINTAQSRPSGRPGLTTKLCVDANVPQNVTVLQFSYVQNYEALQKSFNPVNFNPQKCAKAAQYAGMKYVVFTEP